MTRPLRFVITFSVALAVAAFLPLYAERTMTEVMFADGSGGAIEWGWRRCTLSSFRADYQYMNPMQRPALWCAVNVALAVTYSLAIALVVDLAWRRRQPGAERNTRMTPPRER